MVGAKPVRLTLYSRENCQLCVLMQQQLERCLNDLDYELQLVLIDSDPYLQRRYGGRIPVLEHEQSVLAEYTLDCVKIRQILLSASSSE